MNCVVFNYASVGSAKMQEGTDKRVAEAHITAANVKFLFWFKDLQVSAIIQWDWWKLLFCEFKLSKMSCIVLIGGGIGCGKSTLINYILENKSDLFSESSRNVENEDDHVERESSFVNFCVIQFDCLCSIEEQEQLVS